MENFNWIQGYMARIAHPRMIDITVSGNAKLRPSSHIDGRSSSICLGGVTTEVNAIDVGDLGP